MPTANEVMAPFSDFYPFWRAVVLEWVKQEEEEPQSHLEIKKCFLARGKCLLYIFIEVKFSIYHDIDLKPYCQVILQYLLPC